MPEHWLLLRGLTRSAWHWGPFVDWLRDSPIAAGVMALDLPGVGTERSRSSPTTIEDIMEDVRARWLGAKAGGGWRILGVSMGAMVALAWCQRYPQDFRGAVLVNSSARNVAPAWHRMSLSALPQVVKAAAWQSPRHREKTVLELTSNDSACRRDRLGNWAAYATHNPVSRWTFLAQMAAAARFEAPHGSEVPSLVLSSRSDRLVSSRCSERLAARLGAPLALHSWAGHDLVLDDPQWVMAQLSRHCRQA